MVGANGFEPSTSRSRTERSTRLSHAPHLNVSSFKEPGHRQDNLLLGDRRDYHLLFSNVKIDSSSVRISRNT